MCRICRRSCAMTKKQYCTPKVRVGTIKKSNCGNSHSPRRASGVAPVLGSSVFCVTTAKTVRFRDIESELQQLTVSARSTPGRILSYHAKDQLAYFFWN